MDVSKLKAFAAKTKKIDPTRAHVWGELVDILTGGAPADSAAPKLQGRVFSQAEVDAMKKDYEQKLATAKQNPGQ